MTFKEYIVRLEARNKDPKILSEPLRLAALDTTAKMGERIFDNGLTTTGASIGQYSTNPIYVNPLSLPSGVKKSIGVKSGKTGETVFKSGQKKGQKHKTKYLAGGYKELRNKVGRQIAYVDLSFSNELRFDFGNGSGVATPRKISDLEYQIRLDKTINQEKRSGLEDKYGIIFTTSEAEKKIFFNTVEVELRRRLAA